MLIDVVSIARIRREGWMLLLLLLLDRATRITIPQAGAGTLCTHSLDEIYCMGWSGKWHGHTLVTGLGSFSSL